MHRNTHAPRPTGTQVAGPQPWRTSHKTLGPCSHQEGPEVTGDGGGRGPESGAEETSWKGAPQGGAHTAAGDSRGLLQKRGAAFPRCLAADAWPTTEGPLSGGAGPTQPREQNFFGKVSGVSGPPGSRLGAQPWCGEARPGRVRRKRSGLNGLLVRQGSRGERARRSCRGWAGGPRRSGRPERAAPAPFRAALAASLQPGLGRASGAALAWPRRRRSHLPSSRAAVPGPRASQPMAPAVGEQRARGWPRGAAAGGGAGGGRTGPAARTRPAAGWARGAWGSARDGAKEKVRPGTGQPRRGQLCPRRVSRLCGRQGAGGAARGRAGPRAAAAAGRKASARGPSRRRRPRRGCPSHGGAPAAARGTGRE